ncbi:MAG: GNAT family N-acetyltransferase [Methanomassiliicoccaceae archaeon]|nr:GNAT family N-acetyltransferase [Methanomassiliicoccaceae archaeon]
MRFCGTDEAKELAEMARNIWMEHYPTIIGMDDTEYILGRFQTEEAIRQQIGDGYLYSFIMAGDTKAGYFCIVPESDSLLISKFYISKEFRGKGLGSGTLDDILEKGRMLKKKKVRIRVNKDNVSSIDIYLHKGFKIVRDETVDIGGGHFMYDRIAEYLF